jgi:putative radical SAM enzyme (TIGR03279 family)
MQRIIDQRLSPLYVSVHATEPDLRRELLGIEEYDGFLPKIERLANAGIQMHGQVVLCPGLNDGVHLERTIHDMLQFHPYVASLAIVPVGLTDHRKNLPNLTPFTGAYARDLIAYVKPLQKRLKREFSTPFAFLGDEIYIMAGAEIPPATHYADFPQMENGVGMVRTFLTQFKAALRTQPRGRARGTVCTGKVFYPYLKKCLDRLEMDVRLVPIESKFWGAGIGVAGLLTGSDFIEALQGSVYGDFVVVPSECMVGDDYMFLDDLTLKDVERALGVEIVPSGYDARDFVKFLISR